MSHDENQKDVAQSEQTPVSSQDGVNSSADSTNKGENTGKSYPNSSNQGYPNSGMPQYPQSGMPQYPQSGMPQYPRSAMPPQYPPYAMPYGMSSYMPQKKKMSNSKFAIILVSIVLLVAIGAIVFLLVLKGSDNSETHRSEIVDELETEDVTPYDGLNNFDSFAPYMVGSLKADGTLNIGKAQLMIDGILYPFEDSLLNYENANYVDLEEFAKLFGISVTVDMESKTAALMVNGAEYVITHDMVEGEKMTADGASSSVALNRPPILFSNGRMFVAVKGLSGVFDLYSVDWDSTYKCVAILTNSIKVSNQ